MIRTPPHRRRRHPLDHAPDWCLIVHATGSLWLGFFLYVVLESVTPHIAEAIVSGEPLTPTGLFVILVATVLGGYVTLFGFELTRTTKLLYQRWCGIAAPR